MKRGLIIFVLSVFVVGVFDLKAQEAEKLVNGTVLTADKGEPVVGAVVSATAAEDGRTLAYGLTETDGSFRLVLKDYSGPFRLTVRSMMTETLTIGTAAGNDPLIIRVKEQTRFLKESRIAAPKIRAQGDTLDYNVASFATADDRSIGEVLKRLPGIRVASTGEIFYQNREISRFYVEGLDLLQGRYGLATNHIDPSKVATVQVLENHQPIRVLEGTEIPAEAAINLKLKKSSLGAFFLTAQAGAGLSPLLHSNELLGMRFTQSQQNLFLYKSDNTGRDIAGEMISFYGTSSSPLLSVFSPEMLGAPALDLRHWLFNDAHIVSLNDLHQLGRNFTMTGNLNFLADRQRKTGGWRQTIVDPAGGDLVVAEEVSSSLLTRELTGTMTLERNTKDRYLHNRTDANVAWNRQNCSVLSVDRIRQVADLPSLSFENSFSLMDGKNRWTSRMQYVWQDNALSVSPVLLDDLAELAPSITQQVTAGQFYADLGYRRNIRLSRRLSVETTARLFWKRISFVSGFLTGGFGTAEQPVSADSLSNRLVRNDLGTDAGVGFRFNKRPFSAYISASGQVLAVHREGVNLSGEKGSFRFLPTPQINLEYKRRNMSWCLDASYRESVSDVRSDLTGYLMSSYRFLSRSDGVLPRSGRATAELGVHYRDAASSLFASGMAGYALVRRNTLQSLSYDGILCQTTNIAYANRSDRRWARLQLGTDIRPLSSTLKLDAGVSRSRAVMLFQGRLAEYVQEAATVSSSLYTLFWKFASLSYHADGRLSRSRTDGRKNDPLYDLRQTVQLSVFPFKNATVQLSCNHSYNSGLPSAPSRWFGNIGLRYKYRKTEWMLDGSNIFNTRELVSFYYDDLSSYETRYELRPAELLLRVKISLL